MCLAIYKPAGKTVSWDALEEGFSSNKDGAGFAYVQNDKLCIHRGLFNFDDFRTALLRMARRTRRTAIRFASMTTCA